MFSDVTESWNIVVGCRHGCYFGKCWAFMLTIGKLKHTKKYKDFEPRFWQSELNRKFKVGAFVFVCSMGDLFGEWVPIEWIKLIIGVVRKNPQATFLFLTKNPARYVELEKELDFPENAILGTTIETNRGYDYYPAWTKAPSPFNRYEAMTKLRHKRKFVSIEPIIDFDLTKLVGWIKEIAPCIVYVGYDNYKAGLPEPPLSKTMLLIDALKMFTTVKTKSLREKI